MQVGLTGGIGSGKSAVAQFLRELGALVIDSDELAREAVAPGSESLRQIAERWPQAVLGGVLDRAALANIVFADEAARLQLNAIVHPIVRGLASRRAESALPGQLIVQVIPLLFETGSEKNFAKNVLVVAPDTVRLTRIAARDGAREEETKARIAAQISPARARELADYIIENDGDLTQLQARTHQLYNLLLQNS